MENLLTPARSSGSFCLRSAFTNSNPYETDDTTSGAMPRTQSDPASKSGCLRFGLASSIVATVVLLQYNALDYFVVRLRPYPAEANTYDWVLLLFPITPALVLSALSSTRILRLTIGIGFSSWIFGLILAVPLIATVGIWFHFAIGGTL